MKIFIAEDKIEILKNTVNLVQECCRELALTDYEIIESHQNNTFAKSLDYSEAKSALYILDIDLEQNNKEGIDFAEAINEKDPAGVIVFYTSYPEYAHAAIRAKVDPYTFISKNESAKSVKEQFLNAIDYAYNEYLKTQGRKTSQIKTSKGVAKLDLDDINFVEYYDRNSYIYLKNEDTLELNRVSLSKIEDSLPQLMRTHRSYLINPRNVARYDRSGKEVIFSNGDSCPVSDTYAQNLEEWLYFHKDYIRYFDRK